MSSNPLVSILLPVFNGQAFISEAIESMLSQSYKNFELIVIDDQSTDSSLRIAESYKDPRMRIIRNKKNLGVGVSLNRALAFAKGEYVARLDADDVSLSDRLSRQVSFLLHYPKIAAVGGSAIVIDEFGKEIDELITRARNPVTIKWALLFGSPFVHSSMMFRRKLVLSQLGGYDNLTFVEDFDLWSRMIFQYEMCNLPDYLVKYRIHKDQKTRRPKISKAHYLERKHVISRHFEKLFPDMEISPEELWQFAYFRDYQKKGINHFDIVSFAKHVKKLKQAYERKYENRTRSDNYREFSSREFAILSRLAFNSGKYGLSFEFALQIIRYSPRTAAEMFWQYMTEN